MMRERTQPFESRQVMQRQSFEIFHYQDPKPGRVELHHHDFYEVYFFLGGNVDYRVEGRIFRLEPGDLLLINPMELHHPMVEPGVEAYERIVLWVDKGYLEGFSTGEVSLTRCFDSALPTHTNLLRPTQAQRAELRNRLDELVRESYGGEYGSSLCAQGMFLQFMVELNRLAQQGESAQSRTGEERAPLVEQVLAYIGEHYDQPLSLEGLAQRFYVSKYHLSHEFSRVVGTGLYRYLTLKRLLIAKQMLTNGISPGVVCTNCGFGDYTGFYRAFKSRYGVSPRQYAEDCAR